MSVLIVALETLLGLEENLAFITAKKADVVNLEVREVFLKEKVMKIGRTSH